MGHVVSIQFANPIGEHRSHNIGIMNLSSAHGNGLNQREQCVRDMVRIGNQRVGDLKSADVGENWVQAVAQCRQEQDESQSRSIREALGS